MAADIWLTEKGDTKTRRFDSPLWYGQDTTSRCSCLAIKIWGIVAWLTECWVVPHSLHLFACMPRHFGIEDWLDAFVYNRDRHFVVHFFPSLPKIKRTRKYVTSGSTSYVRPRKHAQRCICTHCIAHDYEYARSSDDPIENQAHPHVVAMVPTFGLLDSVWGRWTDDSDSQWSDLEPLKNTICIAYHRQKRIDGLASLNRVDETAPDTD